MRKRYSSTLVYFSTVVIFVLLLKSYNKIPEVVYVSKNKDKNQGFSKDVLIERLSRRSYFQNDLILFYTTFFGQKPWTRRYIDKNEKCRVKIPCESTYDKDRFVDSRAVIFHAADTPSYEELQMLHSHPIRKQQFWVYFTMENPFNARFNPLYDGMFNYTMSYRLSSDIHFPYRHYFRIRDESKINLNATNYAENKTRQVAWMVSNCGNLRDEFVKKLQFYSIDISVGGKCSQYYSNQLNCDDMYCEKTLRKFKFFLALENNFCRDYVTEKYWFHPFQYNMIPIVLGGANYNNPKLAIPGSFVNIFEFKNIKRLAEFIHGVDANDTWFNSFFAWRQKWEFFSENFECNESINQLCTKITEIPSNMNRTKERLFSKELDDKDSCYARVWLFKKWILGR